MIIVVMKLTTALIPSLSATRSVAEAALVSPIDMWFCRPQFSSSSSSLSSSLAFLKPHRHHCSSRILMSSNNDHHNSNNNKINNNKYPFIFTYQLGKSIYIPLTSKCNSKTLPETRGGHPFLKSLPIDVLTPLMLVKILEKGITRRQGGGGERGERGRLGKEEEEEELILKTWRNQKTEIEKEIRCWVSSSPSSNPQSRLTSTSKKKELSIDEKIVQSIFTEYHNDHYSTTTTTLNQNDDVDQDEGEGENTSPGNNKENDYYKCGASGSGSGSTTSGSTTTTSSSPSVKALYNEIQQRMVMNSSLSTKDKETETAIESIVFAGEGEPTLRMDAILSLSKLIRDNIHKDIPIRVLTNGLLYYDYDDNMERKNKHRETTLHDLKDAGVTSLSIALQTSCPIQYNELMDPSPYTQMRTERIEHSHNLPSSLSSSTTSSISSSLPHECLCKFIKDAVDIGLDVEVTGVLLKQQQQHQQQQQHRHDLMIDVEETERFATEQLGVLKPFRWRTWFGDGVDG